MDNQEMREFYDICQAYRHAPIQDMVYVAHCYESLLNWVKAHSQLAEARGMERAAKVSEGWGYENAAAAIRADSAKAGKPCVTCGNPAPHIFCSYTAKGGSQ